MARGLLAAWKQPIYYDFDSAMSKETYLTLVKKLYSAGFIVIATTSDLGSTNQGLLTKMGINVFKTFISHPSDGNLVIFFFPDVPHLIKLIRNHLLDQGFLLANEKFISKTGLEELLQIQKGDLKTAFKLTREMLDVQGTARQRVSPATKLFSNNNANALMLAGKEKLISYNNYVELSNFLKLVNDWFDIHNSNSLYGKHEGLNAYTGTENQIRILDEMTKTMKQMRVKGHNSCLPFQNGIIIANESLKLLYNYAKEKYGIKYILTRKLDQDDLENFFGFIRSMGRQATHPDPMEFTYRMRLYLLSKHGNVVFSEHTNCEQVDEPDITISSKVFASKIFEEVKEDNEAPVQAPVQDTNSKELDEVEVTITSEMFGEALQEEPISMDEIMAPVTNDVLNFIISSKEDNPGPPTLQLEDDLRLDSRLLEELEKLEKQEVSYHSKEVLLKQFL